MDSTTCFDIHTIGAITSDVPVPPRRDRQPAFYPKVTALLRRLEVGDSVLLPREAKDGLFNKAQLIGIRITTRIQGDDAVRVWRTA